MEKHCHAHHHNKFFKSFLIIYLIFSLILLSEHNFSSGIAIAGIGFGFILALLAHSRYGYLTIALLLVHMLIEWSEHSMSWQTYSSREIILHGIHAIMDFIFLFQELRAHLFKYWKISYIAVIIIIVTMIIINFGKVSAEETEGISNIIIEAFVVGGMYGCILSHLFKREKCVEVESHI